MSATSSSQAQGLDTAARVQNFAREKGVKPCEAIARLAGFGSYEQYRQARFVVDHGAPELCEAMDTSKISIYNAAFIARYPTDIQQEIVAMDRKKIIRLVKVLKLDMRKRVQEGLQ